VAGATVFQIIAVDRGYDYILQLHLFDGFGQLARLIWGEGVRLAMTHIAKRTASGTDFTHNHEGGRTVGKTLPYIRAAGFLAYGGKLSTSENTLNPTNL
jgi:hypothetical protein